MHRSTARVALRVATRAVVFLGVACSGSGENPVAGTPLLAFQRDSTRPYFGSVSVAPLDPRGLSALERSHPSTDDWRKILLVRAGDSASLPMIGSYVVAHDTLRFDPQFPPVRGTTYSARFSGEAFNARSSGNAPAVISHTTWTRPLPAGASTTSVLQVYPTADSLPMNLLRMYVQFSGPMTVGDDAEKHIHLLDEKGAVVEKAFLIAAGGQELWDPEHTRLTIFFDPGRIKRDLTPHEALGLPLREGHSYSLTIDSSLHDAHGLPLTRSFVKKFKAGPIDRTLPRAQNWRVSAPRAGTRDPLTLDLPEPLDHALLNRMLAVRRGDGGTVLGTVVTSKDDRVWSFIPTEPWSGAPHSIEVDPELEDLAGNNLHHLFDVMPGDSAARGTTQTVVRIAFAPK
jgi:hypothetical protein